MPRGDAGSPVHVPSTASEGQDGTGLLNPTPPSTCCSNPKAARWSWAEQHRGMFHGAEHRSCHSPSPSALAASHPARILTGTQKRLIFFAF